MDLSKPILIYDGDCGFCLQWIERWRDIAGDRVDYAPYQEAGTRFPEISTDAFKAAVQLVETDMKIYQGAEAVLRSLASNPSYRWLWLVYSHIPGMRFLTNLFYRNVTTHRLFFSKVSSLLWGKNVRRSTYFFSSALFLRFMGLIYLVAFVSLGTQVLGLSGSHGIFPAQAYLDAVQNHVGADRFRYLPTLAWFNASDTFLQFLCWGGAAFSVLVMAGILPMLFLFLAWMFYLSLVSVGGPFTAFQWDVLLLETGFLAIFLVPRAPGIIRFLLKILLFKLMFLSGWAKLASHDPAWRNLTALQYHYQTQPLPAWTSWYLHHLPAWFQTTSCFLMFVIELAVPFFIFFPRRVRHLNAGALVGFQILIFVSGNYTFFNVLAGALCLLLFDDTVWRYTPPKSSKNDLFRKMISGSVVVLIFTLYLGLLPSLRSFYLVNRYGLFAVMTTERQEIVIEGSVDGKQWLPYEFKYKPGDVSRRPEFIEPFQPRLDWQMWFAALSRWQQNRWFVSFCQRLLQGRPEVTALLAKNPFPDHPPRFLRSLVYDYQFTGGSEKKTTGAWWRRELKGAYSPVMSLKSSGPDR